MQFIRIFLVGLFMLSLPSIALAQDATPSLPEIESEAFTSEDELFSANIPLGWIAGMNAVGGMVVTNSDTERLEALINFAPSEEAPALLPVDGEIIIIVETFPISIFYEEGTILSPSFAEDIANAYMNVIAREPSYQIKNRIGPITTTTQSGRDAILGAMEFNETSSYLIYLYAPEGEPLVVVGSIFADTEAYLSYVNRVFHVLASYQYNGTVDELMALLEPEGE